MGSAPLRAIIEMRWEKESEYRFTGDGAQALLPREQQWRYARLLSGRPSTLPGPGNPPSMLLWMCYARLVQQEKERRDSLELYDLILRVKLHNRLVASLASSGEAATQGQIGNDDLDVLLTHLWQVQKTTNPLAIRPQTEKSDQLTEDMEKIKDFLEHGAPFQVVPTG